MAKITSNIIRCRTLVATYTDDKAEAMGLPPSQQNIWVDLRLAWDAVAYLYMYVKDGVEIGTVFVDFAGTHLSTDAPYESASEMYSMVKNEILSPTLN